jgi:predicted phosphodiesterase
MSENAERKIVRKLIKDGYGRRRIAQAIGTTEWYARTIVNEILELDSKAKQETKSEKRDKPKTRSGRPNSKKKRTTGKPTIKTTHARPIGNSETIDSDKPAKVTTRPSSFKVAVLSDIHYPYENVNVMKIVKAILRDNVPDMIILNGDILDCYSVSRYDKSPLRKKTIQDEFDYGFNRLGEFVDEFTETEFKMLEGNHEARFKKLLISQHVGEYLSLRDMTIENQLGLKELGIEFVPESKDLEIGRMTIMHGNKVRKQAGASVRAHHLDIGTSVIIGHVHRMSTAWKRNKWGAHVMIENGALCDFDVEYARFPDWQHGFSMLHFDGEDLNVTQYPITDYKCITPDKVYTI